MRLLLACVLALLPMAAQAENIDKLGANESDQMSGTEPFIAKNSDDPNSAINELGLYGNPYNPASATNFEALPESSMYDPGQLNTNFYNPDWLSTPFGHYGTPYSPHQFNNR